MEELTGEIGVLIRSHDWSDTPLGAVENWSSDLKKTVQILATELDRARTLSTSSNELLSASKQRYQTLFDSIDQGFCICEMLFGSEDTPDEYRFLAVNSVYERMTGLKKVVGRTAREIIPDLEDFWFETYKEVVLTGKSVRFENQVSAMNQWFDVNAFPIDAPEKNRFGILFTNVTDRKLLEEKLRQSEERMRLAVECSQMGAWDLDLVNGNLIWSKQQFTMIGYEPSETGEVHHEMWLSLIYPDDQAQVQQEWQKSQEEQRLYRAEHRLHRADNNQIVWLSAMGSFTYDDNGRAVRSLGVMFDISDRKHIEEALYFSRERLDLVLEAAGLGLWYCDLPFDRLDWNETCRLHAGLTPEAEATIDLFYERIHPSDRERVQQKIAQSIENHLKYDIDYRTVDLDGTVRWIRSIGRVFYDTTGKPIRFDGVTIDMTKQKEVEQALYQSEARYRHLAESIPQLVWISNTSGLNEYVNQRMCEYTGLRSEQIMDLDWQAIVHADDWEQTQAHWLDAARQQNLFEAEYRLRRADGSYRWHLGRSIPIRDDLGNTLRWFGTATDIEDQKQLEQQNKLILTQVQERNQELDQFAHIVSHDLKAPLRAIANLSEWIEEDLAELLPEANKAQMQLLRNRVYQMEALLNSILEYARVGLTQQTVESVCVQTLLLEILDVLQPPSSFQVEIAPNMPTLDTQLVLLKQVFMNLIDNAVKHHPDPAGWVKVSVQDQVSFYKFAIADNGQGIDPKSHEKIFAIFQTLGSKNSNGSTGVGLAIVKKIVESQGGKIELESEVGKGSTFHFTWRK